MTISNTITTVSYQGNGVTTHFAFPFRVDVEDDLYVWIADASSFAYLQDSDTYTINGLGDPAGGEIVLKYNSGALPSTRRVVIQRKIPYTQDTDLNNQGGLYLAALEKQLDRIVMQIQQVADDAGRAYKTAPGQDPIDAADIQSAGVYAAQAAASASQALALVAGLAGVPSVVDTLAALKSVDTTVVKTAILRDDFNECLCFWRTGNFTGLNDLTSPTPRYVKANAIAITVGAWELIGSPILDGSKPLKFGEFYRENNYDATQALRDAIAAMAFASTVNCRTVLDLEGYNVKLTAQVNFNVLIGQTNRNFFIKNGRISEIVSGLNADYLLNLNGLDGTNSVWFDSIVFDGNDNANWIKADAVDLHFRGCVFTGNYNTSTPGVYASGLARVIISDCYFNSPTDMSAAPTARSRVAVSVESDDLLVTNTRFAYYRVGLDIDGFGAQITNCHFLQDQPGSVPSSMTQAIRFSAGYIEAVLTNVHLDGGYVELGNYKHTTITQFGRLVAVGIRGEVTTSDGNFAFFRVRDYGANTGCSVQDVTITGSQFKNTNGTTQVEVTRLHNAGNFDTTLNDTIKMNNNNFIKNVLAQSDPLTMSFTSSSSTSKSYDFTGYLPFGGNPRSVTSIVAGNLTVGAGVPLYVEDVNRTNDVVKIGSATNTAGPIAVTVTQNARNANNLIIN